MPFFILFIIIPLSEIIVFMSVSDKIGLGTALLMALFTAILGGALVRHQGIQTLMTAQKSMQQGILPSKELFDGLCLVAAGATLITPGFITDTIGFLLLIPQIRDFLRSHVSKSAIFESASFSSEHTSFQDHRSHNRPNDPTVIDVEYETIDEQDKR